MSCRRTIRTCKLNTQSFLAAMKHGHVLGIDVGLKYFLSTSDGEPVKRPRNERRELLPPMHTTP